MSINLDTNLHTNVRVISVPDRENLSLEEFIKYLKKNKELILGKAKCTMTDQFVELVNAALYANNVGINVAEHLDIISYIIGQGLYSGRLRDALAAVGVSVEEFDATRKAHLEAYKMGVPVFRKDSIVIDLASYVILRDAGKITSETNIRAAVVINEALMNLMDSFEKE